MIAALILAAGKSERMGYPKALLRLGRENFAQRLLRICRDAGVDRMGIVLGHQAAELGAALQLGAVPIIVNQEYERGQLASLQCGMTHLPLDACEALIVMPIDHPLISAELLRRLVARYQAGCPSAVIPTCRGKRGHPTLFSRHLFQDLLQCPSGWDARSVLQQHADRIAYLEGDDAAILLNIDAPDDYRRLLQLRDNAASISGSENHTDRAHESLVTAGRFCPRCTGRLVMRPADLEGKLQRTCAVCGYVLYLNPKLAACTLLEHDGKLLLIRRNIDPGKGLWTLPGGYVDLGESVPQAALRETREEVGLQVSLQGLLGIYSYPGNSVVIVIYLARPLQDQLTLNAEVQEARYFAPGEIPWQELAFRSTGDALRDWLAHRELPGGQDPPP